MIARYIPHWLAWPVSLLSTVVALTGCGLIFWAAADGEYTPAVWAAGAFVGAGVLWYLADMAASNRPLG
jgi:multisubunit Na+/H+ antiporter MnhE subunit